MRAISTAVLKLTDMLQKQRGGCEGRKGNAPPTSVSLTRWEEYIPDKKDRC